MRPSNPRLQPAGCKAQRALLLLPMPWRLHACLHGALAMRPSLPMQPLAYMGALAMHSSLPMQTAASWRRRPSTSD